MVHFHSVRYKNFLSTGNYWLTIPLDKHAQTIIVGSNGSGKTTLLDALMFALFGKPYRNINKPLLVNSVNKRDCMVQVEFTTNNKRYLVERGIKPNVFRIQENGVWLDEDAHSMDMQDVLEQTILKFTEKAFKQVILLGASSFVPFMRLTAGERRSVIEDLLDIQVFSGMNSLLKERVSQTKDRLANAQYAKALLEDREKLSNDYKARLRESVEAEATRRDETRKQLIEQLKYSQEKLKAAIEARKEALPFLCPDAVTKQVAVKTKLEELVRNIGKIESKLAVNAILETCPTCEQALSDHVKHKRCTEFETQIAALKSNVVKAEAFIAKQQERIDQHNKYLQLISGYDADIRQYQTMQSQLKTQITALDKTKELANQAVVDMPGVSADEWLAVDAELEKALYQQHVEGIATSVLKDSGIKTRVVQHYLPIINHLINKYLGALNFPIQFMLDGQFKESIKARHRDDFSYESFSEGEKKRIDLALLLTWRSVARLKNSTFTNILILDEVFDSALDGTGTDDFIRLMQSLEADVNVIVISHKTDSIVERFNNVLHFAKTRGFSHFTETGVVTATVSDADSVR